ITVLWILRVYAVVDHGLVFAIMLSLLGLAIVGFDILQGVQSSCTHNTLSSETLSGVMTYISLAVFDILATLLVTNRMIQAIRGCGGFRKLARQNLSEYVLRDQVSQFSLVVTIPQIIAVVLYFVGVPLVSQAILILHLTGSTGTEKIARLIVLRISGTIQPYPEQFSSRVSSCFPSHT
ncbi:uncharacterized protein C8R40DRAFT_1095655, partial [Lentinula edodes]|uniref:uncharacterized protein n=1 Tax=Lentinula edodes TaxID=5353 RepID=UPI001E8E2982